MCSSTIDAKNSFSLLEAEFTEAPQLHRVVQLAHAHAMASVSEDWHSESSYSLIDSTEAEEGKRLAKTGQIKQSRIMGAESTEA
ncbi:hypothetical protein C0Q70_09289 [Pomacea canaliculata]|uniref:Uncharacterized protein n=1 Tax=Pomacea canaliculata TaxID=400727 RepID=A0A2T7P9D4_POMCA|nr:hypothetical protein C0Q70_09289 [Pomacea canaliculata]